MVLPSWFSFCCDFGDRVDHTGPDLTTETRLNPQTPGILPSSLSWALLLQIWTTIAKMEPRTSKNPVGKDSTFGTQPTPFTVSVAVFVFHLSPTPPPASTLSLPWFKDRSKILEIILLYYLWVWAKISWGLHNEYDVFNVVIGTTLGTWIRQVDNLSFYSTFPAWGLDSWTCFGSSSALGCYLLFNLTLSRLNIFLIGEKQCSDLGCLFSNVISNSKSSLIS